MHAIVLSSYESLNVYNFPSQCCSPWEGMEMGLRVNSPSPFRGNSMTAAPLRAEMMVTAGAPQLRTTTGTHPMASALKLVLNVICVFVCYHNTPSSNGRGG